MPLASEYTDRGEWLWFALGDCSRDSNEKLRARWRGVDGTELECGATAAGDVDCLKARGGNGCANSIFFGGTIFVVVWLVSLFATEARSPLLGVAGVPLFPWQLCEPCRVRCSCLDVLEADRDRVPAWAVWADRSGGSGGVWRPPPRPGAMSLLYCSNCAWKRDDC